MTTSIAYRHFRPWFLFEPGFCVEIAQRGLSALARDEDYGGLTRPPYGLILIPSVDAGRLKVRKKRFVPLVSVRISRKEYIFGIDMLVDDPNSLECLDH